MQKSFFNHLLGALLVMNLSLVLPACLVIKKYDHPQVATDSLYRTNRLLDSSQSMASISWKKLFADTFLQSYINMAMQHNTNMNIAIQNVFAAESQIKRAKSIYLPDISLTPNVTTQKISGNSQFGRVFNGTITQFEFSAKVSWEVDIWGKLKSTQRADIAKFLAIKEAQKAVQTQLIADVAITYYQLLSLDEKLRLTKSALENRVQGLQTTLALYQSGLATEVAVQQTEAQKYGVEIAVEDLKYNIQTTENAMCMLLGISAQAIKRSSLEKQKIDVDIQLGIPALLLSQRPDVLIAELNYRNMFELTNVAKTNFYPSLLLTPTGGFQSLEIEKWFSANSLFSSVIGGITAPILNKRQIKTNYEVAKRNQEIAFLNFKQTLLTAGKEVSDALAGYENETIKMQIGNRQVAILQKAVQNSDELLQLGSINYLEVLTAKDNSLDAQLQLTEGRFQRMKAVVSLYRSLGGGLY